MTVFVIEDDVHAEWCGRYSSFDDALAELEVRSRTAWNEKPNVCPCKSWRTCGRAYAIVEFDTSEKPWSEVNRTSVLTVSSEGTQWDDAFKKLT